MEEQATLVIEASTPYVGRWNRLVSSTNWEKGRIICQWRSALQEAGAPAGDYGDEAWSRQVGGVSPQHVGRLRRVCEQFGEVFEQYAGLYWSHFQAAVEWNDAEMWLEGAVQSGWSVAGMRAQRWEALGGQPELEPREADVAAAEWDEDAAAPGDGPLPEAVPGSLGEVRAAGRPREEGDETWPGEPSDPLEAATAVADAPAAAPLRPFESLPAMPPDLNEAFDLFRLAILNHKVSGWREIARSDLLAVLESLKQLALAPAE